MGTYLGQNFLIDSKIRHWIGDKVKQMYVNLGAEHLIEIGPGKGSLTKLIKDISPNFWIFEKDETLKEKLSEVLTPSSATLPLPLSGESKKENYQIIWGDVLDADLSQISREKSPTTSFHSVSSPFPAVLTGRSTKGGLNPDTTLVVGNLPYYITSPILRKFFATGKVASSQSSSQGQFLGGLFMIQDEVGEKIRYDAKKKSYLYRLLNYGYQVEYLKTVPAKAFSPAPKVKSCMVGLTKKSEVPQIEFEKLVRFLDMFSPYSRKTLGKISKMLEKKGNSFFIAEQFQGKRLEELGWKDLEEILG